LKIEEGSYWRAAADRPRKVVWESQNQIARLGFFLVVVSKFNLTVKGFHGIIGLFID